jgi:hypothetical protein
MTGFLIFCAVVGLAIWLRNADMEFVPLSLHV